MTGYVDRLQEGAVSIFLFHGVIDSPTTKIRNYTNKHLLAARFEEILEGLSGAGTPMSMDDVIGWHGGEIDLPPRAFAVTFDDGFENNHSIAAPILRSLAIPATFYVSTHLIEENAMSWIDRIEYAVELGTPKSLALPWHEEPLPCRTIEETTRCLEDVRNHVKKDASVDVDALVSDIFEQCGVDEAFTSDHPLDKKMSWTQVAELNQEELFTVGGHSHHHVVLSFLSRATLETEIATSLGLLQDKASVGPRHYSYPEGLDHCFSDEVIEVLRSNGVRCCPTAIEGTNPPGTDLFHLRRIAVV